MAEVDLGRYEAEQGELPPVCLGCGQPAALYRGRTLVSHPRLVYLLLLAGLPLYFLIALLTHRRLTVVAPFCERHRHFWFWNRLPLTSAYAAIAGLLLLCLVLLAASPVHMNNKSQAALMLVWLAGVTWLVAGFLLRLRMLRARKITEEGGELTGAAEAFALALHAERLAGATASSPRPSEPRARPGRALPPGESSRQEQGPG